MKKLCKKVWQYVEGLNGLLLIIYAACIVVTQAFLDSSARSLFLRWAFLGVIACAVLCPLVLRRVRKLTVCNESESRFLVADKTWKTLFFLLPFLAFAIRYVAYYPGGMSNDTINQYAQVVSGQYNDWHPVIQTLLAIKLPLLLTGGWIGSVTLLQIIAFSLVIGYCLCTVKEYAGTGYAAASLLFILINPTIANNIMFPWKDVTFAMGALVLVCYALRIYRTKGQWLKKPLHLALFAVVSALTALVRHNGVLFVAPLVIAAVLCVSWKRALAVCLSILVLVCGIQYPLYSALQVEKPDQRQVETLGLPMTVIGAAVTYTPDALDEDILEFAYRVAPRQVWESKYEYGNYNEVKWDPETDNTVIEEYGTKEVISMALRCIRQSPTVSLKALIKLTNVVYSVSDDQAYYELPRIQSNSYGLSTQGIGLLQRLNYLYTRLTTLLLPHLVLYVGMMHLVLLVGILAKFVLSKWRDWKKILFILPVFCYNFGSALLLTGAADSSRLFFYTFLLMPVLLIFIFGKEKEGSADAAVCESV